MGGSARSAGERPPGPFGDVPVSELAILTGAIAAVVGFLRGGGPALPVGIAICALGVLEFTLREHLSGFRSHTTLLACYPAALVVLLVALLVGHTGKRELLLLPGIPVFAACFWLLRRRFRIARQLRVARAGRR